MKPVFKPVRRRFLGLVGLAFTPAIVHLIQQYKPATAYHDTAACAGKLVATLKRKGSARAVGQAYLQLRPHEADVDFLVRTLVGSKMTGKGSMQKDKLAEMLDHRRRQDFRDGEIVALEGWLLARSELRLCALATMV